jgi:hypothetical protein
MNKKLFTAEEMIEFELFTAEQMIEFASWYGDISEKELNSYKDMLKQRQEKEYQLYLTLKAKYE